MAGRAGKPSVAGEKAGAGTQAQPIQHRNSRDPIESGHSDRQTDNAKHAGGRSVAE